MAAAKSSVQAVWAAVTVEPLVRFETPPGKQMQVDFISIRRGRDRLSAFVATLGYSRATFVQFVTDETIETVLAAVCLIPHAFGNSTSAFASLRGGVILSHIYEPLLNAAYLRGR